MTLEGRSLLRAGVRGRRPQTVAFVSSPYMVWRHSWAHRQLPGLLGSGVRPSTDPLRHAHGRGKGVAPGGREQPIRHKCPGTNSRDGAELADAEETCSARTRMLSALSQLFCGVLPTSPGTVWPSGRENQVLRVGAVWGLRAGAWGVVRSLLLTPLRGAAPGNRAPQHETPGIGTRMPYFLHVASKTQCLPPL